MDNVAGVVAFRHCRTNVVTASVGRFKLHQSRSIFLSLPSRKRAIFQSNGIYIKLSLPARQVVQKIKSLNTFKILRVMVEKKIM